MSRLTRRVIEPLLGLLVLASVLSAQNTSSDTLVAAHAGRAVANEQRTIRWFAAGVGGGFILGPVGAGLAVGVAETRRTPLPPHQESWLAAADQVYSEVFARAYRERLRARRRRSAIVGGALGTVALGVLIYNWRETGPLPAP